MIVCPFCSEEHPVTLDRCPLTGHQLREPAPVDALPAPPERTPFGALLVEAVRLYRRNLLVFVVTSSVAFVPVAALQYWAMMDLAPMASVTRAMSISMNAAQQRRPMSAREQEQLQRALERARPDPKDLFMGIVLAVMLVPVFLASQTLSHAALVPLVGNRSVGGNMGPGGAWLAVGLRAGAILWTALLSTLVTTIGFLFCLLPGVLATVGFALTMPVVLLERRRGVDALRRSWRLMRVEWPRVLGLWLVAVVAMILLTSILSMAVSLCFTPAQMTAFFSRWMLIGFGVQMVMWMLLFPLPVIGITLVYLHARREQENVPMSELQLQITRAATGT
jgi:hypothetical protein